LRGSANGSFGHGSCCCFLAASATPARRATVSASTVGTRMAGRVRGWRKQVGKEREETRRMRAEAPHTASEGARAGNGQRAHVIPDCGLTGRSLCPGTRSRSRPRIFRASSSCSVACYSLYLVRACMERVHKFKLQAFRGHEDHSRPLGVAIVTRNSIDAAIASQVCHGDVEPRRSIDTQRHCTGVP
jgi:hypothetical protein